MALDKFFEVTQGDDPMINPLNYKCLICGVIIYPCKERLYLNYEKPIKNHLQEHILEHQLDQILKDRLPIPKTNSNPEKE